MTGDISQTAPILELDHVGKAFGIVVALQDISIAVRPGEVHCLLGDNGAGKSTLIKMLAGVHQPTSGEMRVDGVPTVFDNPRQALDKGIATVFQDLAMIPLMSITRNFFLGREPTRGRFITRRLDMKKANEIVHDELNRMGINVRDPEQAVGTLSGGERQCVAIARAVYHGARVLILDEPTSALGVHQASIVLRYIAQARSRGIGVVFITHNIHHAYPIGDVFTLLNRGRVHGTFRKAEITETEVLELMAGRRDLQHLQAELARIPAAAPPGAAAH
ncbi:monosaccharide ABC transporter ATP-binding protein, CUT2 family (TC 3.A.1.2.-) [Pseudoxanthobacter soli DSM 19599]|uniref:Monosaccharide ABC transporter ATP-binding protein, CUT2 family (TC 3.A.1.2.-) n=1 Tax=Pseudoxanthobacter soli DSM 19599 TaxID=1123029 RepID=A0A1M7ZQ13_9HYPH|nr:ATP-binding cassette domain-containing protein [Pseudoxanthobacter soli]SHO66736.1 monosaccharide ABC transporter ATP-binding protein, CUT2 family (TC 3.A.1.2.-) [Pseudoxanthobacter soli DSM 19599]